MPPRFIVPAFSAMVPALVSRLPELRVSVPALLVMEPRLVQVLVGANVSVPAPLLTMTLLALVLKLVGLILRLPPEAFSCPLLVKLVTLT